VITKLARFKRLAKFALALIGVVALFMGYLYVSRHFITENIDHFALWSDESKKRYFSETFPTRNEIERYLSNATILISHPPIGNTVYYFDSDGRYYYWHGNDNMIGRGHWFLYPRIVRRIYNGRSRFDLAYLFCRELDDGSFTDDNCVLLGSTDQIMKYHAFREYAKGDVFNLSELQSPPFDLPPRPISMEQLSATMSHLPH
jgi:hypothetical protein